MKLPSLACGTLGFGLAVNALTMLTQPERWYHWMPGVTLTGDFNAHFVRDIGCAYAVASLGLIWRALRPNSAMAAGAALAGSAFLLSHAGVHAWELMAGLCGWGRFLQDVPGVVLTALLALSLAWPAREARHA